MTVSPRTPRPALADPFAPVVGHPLAPQTGEFERWKSRQIRELAARAIPSSLLAVRGARTPKRVALTFDDGPDEMTPAYLDLCDALNVRATFFVVGRNVERAPGAIFEYARRGHEVASHGFTHAPFPTLAPAVLIDELTHTADLLPASVATRPFVRPPHGAITASSLARVAAAGYTTVLWSLDSDDCRTRDPAVVVDRVDARRVRGGEIVLLHELQPWTLAALPPIVEGLRAAGFELCTVGEVLGF